MIGRGARGLRVGALALAFAVCVAVGCGGSGEAVPPAQADATGIDPVELERLRALGYVGVGDPLPADAEVGVQSFDRERAAAGINLFSNSHVCAVQLIDMEGRVLHDWKYEPCYRWGNAVLLPHGDLVVVGREPHESGQHEAFEAYYAMRLSWDGELVWKKPVPAHHDIEPTPDGNLLTLTYEHEIIPEFHETIGVRTNAMTLLSPDGDVLEQIPLLGLLRSSPRIFTLTSGRPRLFQGGREVDLFHANSIEWMRHPQLIGSHPIYGANHVLICVRNQDTLAIVDWDARKLVWAWGKGELSGPHDATMLPDGNILVFDNGMGRNWSRVVEVDPRRNEIVWQYKAEDPEKFYTLTRGANQRLANGNTLITESEKGRVFEVTPKGEIVWDFINHNITQKREPSVIVRMRRYDGMNFDELAAAVGSEAGLARRVD